jgi:hypothetical protein
MESSAEVVQYNETYTISWTSTGSQCYASGSWSGERPVSGSETFSAKTNGQVGYGMECRKNNIFAPLKHKVTLCLIWGCVWLTSSALITILDCSSDLVCKLTCWWSLYACVTWCVCNLSELAILTLVNGINDLGTWACWSNNNRGKCDAISFTFVVYCSRSWASLTFIALICSSSIVI